MPLNNMSQREYAGEEKAKPLITWLNSHRKRTDNGYKRIANLIRNMAELQSVTEGSFLWAAADVAVLVKRKGTQACLREVRQELRKYKVWPELKWLSGPRLDFAWKYGDPLGPFVLDVVMLGQRGLLDRLRRCLDCESWFWARIRHKQFCSVKCQQAHYKSSPKWKEHRRKYMQEYRGSTGRSGR
jgi:hypothetical protein